MSQRLFPNQRQEILLRQILNSQQSLSKEVFAQKESSLWKKILHNLVIRLDQNENQNQAKGRIRMTLEMCEFHSLLVINVTNKFKKLVFSTNSNELIKMQSYMKYKQFERNIIDGSYESISTFDAFSYEHFFNSFLDSKEILFQRKYKFNYYSQKIIDNYNKYCSTEKY